MYVRKRNHIISFMSKHIYIIFLISKRRRAQIRNEQKQCVCTDHIKIKRNNINDILM